MVFGWFKRKADHGAVNGARKDLERFLASIRRQSNEELGAVMALAAVVRLALRKSGLLPDELLRITDDPEQSKAQANVARLISRYQSEKRFTEATGAMVWLHSLRALSFPEVRYLGTEMWRQLERGREHTQAALQLLGVTALAELTLECGRMMPRDLGPGE
jgi:hypothetical protein